MSKSKISFFFTILIISTLFFHVNIAMAETTVTPPWCGDFDSISGTIFKADGQPLLENARIRFDSISTGEMFFTSTDPADGSYQCGLNDGEYLVHAFGDGYHRETYPNSYSPVPISVTNGVGRSDVDFQLRLPLSIYDHLTFNQHNPILQDPNVRHAIALAVDRQTIIDTIAPLNRPMDNIVTSGHWAYTNIGIPQYQYSQASIDQAKALLQDSGWIDSDDDDIRDNGADRLEFDYVVHNYGDPNHYRVDVANFIKINLQSIGIQINVIQTDIPEFNRRLFTDQDYDIFQFAWGDYLYQNPVSWLDYDAEFVLLTMGYENPEFDDIFLEMNSKETLLEEIPFSHEIQRILMEDLPLFPLMQVCSPVDLDCDLIVNEIDSDPLVFNPEQADVDGDGFIDLVDLCPADATNSCDQLNSFAEVIGPNGGEVVTPNRNVAVSLQPGSLDEFSSITVTDLGSGFVLGDIAPVFAVNIGPDGTSFEIPIAITLSWTDDIIENYVDATGEPEAGLFISKDGVPITDVCALDPGCNPEANTFSVQVTSLSNFVLGNYVSPIIGPTEPVPVTESVYVHTAFSTSDFQLAVWDWGDGKSSDSLSDAGIIEGNHIYNEAGVYTVQLTIQDVNGAIYTITSQYIVVYDPNGGFVTGGGWIESPAGAFIEEPELTGKATFGFVSKYKKGASVPDGNTEFQFKAGDLNFHSSDYDWLVVTGSDYARFKGTGTINGQGEYKFMIWAGDGEPDTFRIKIWEEVDEEEFVIYDNGMDQPIGGGNIVVHTK